MRDLQGIAEINGPRRAELQAERIRDIQPVKPHTIKAYQAKHGERAELRRQQEARR